MAIFRKLILATTTLLLLLPLGAVAHAKMPPTPTEGGWVPIAKPGTALKNAVKISRGPKQCAYRGRSVTFVANAYKRKSSGFSTADGWRTYLEKRKLFYSGGTPTKGRPVFYLTSGGGLTGIATGTGYVYVPNGYGCIKKYPVKNVPGTWYYGWGKARFPTTAPYWP